MIGVYNRDEKCLPRATNWVFKQSSLLFVFRGLISNHFLQTVFNLSRRKSENLTRNFGPEIRTFFQGNAVFDYGSEQRLS